MNLFSKLVDTYWGISSILINYGIAYNIVGEPSLDIGLDKFG